MEASTSAADAGRHSRVCRVVAYDKCGALPAELHDLLEHNQSNVSVKFFWWLSTLSMFKKEIKNLSHFFVIFISLNIFKNFQ
jgi:hypothetical protein